MKTWSKQLPECVPELQAQGTGGWLQLAWRGLATHRGRGPGGAGTHAGAGSGSRGWREGLGVWLRWSLHRATIKLMRRCQLSARAARSPSPSQAEGVQPGRGIHAAAGAAPRCEHRALAFRPLPLGRPGVLGLLPRVVPPWRETHLAFQALLRNPRVALQAVPRDTEAQPALLPTPSCSVPAGRPGFQRPCLPSSVSTGSRLHSCRPILWPCVSMAPLLASVAPANTTLLEVVVDKAPAKRFKVRAKGGPGCTSRNVCSLVGGSHRGSGCRVSAPLFIKLH